MDNDDLHAMEQMRCVTEPHRRAVFRRLMARPSTITQLGAAFGKHPAWIRHHVLALMKVGLVELAEERVVRNYTEKFYRATSGGLQFHAILAPDFGGDDPLLVMGSDDLAVDALAALSTDGRGRPEIVAIPTGSLDGLVALRQGLADVAGCHLIDVDTDEYNTPYVRHMFPDRPMVIVTLAHREQGLLLAPGNPLGLREVDDLAQAGVRFVNRNKGSGTRVWFDRALRRAGIPAAAIDGYETQARTHLEVAKMIRQGSADAGLGMRAAARAEGLDFAPLFRERFDLVFDAEAYETDSRLDPLRCCIEEAEFRRAVSGMAGYDVTCSGSETRIAI